MDILRLLSLSRTSRGMTRGKAILAASCALNGMLFAGSVSILTADPEDVVAQETKLSRDKERVLSRVDLTDWRTRWRSYRAVSEIFDRLWLEPHSTSVLAERERATFKAFPLLRLEDRDGDGAAEFFSYLPPDSSGRTQEFGAFFDLDKDDRTDWIVFYGGVLFTKNMQPFYWHHHSIDTNGDGQFDERIYAAIDLDGDGFPENGTVAWLRDVDHDGKVDSATHVVDGRASNLEAQDGSLNLRYLLNPELSEQPRIGGPMPTDLFELIARDIDDLSGN